MYFKITSLIMNSITAGVLCYNQWRRNIIIKYILFSSLAGRNLQSNSAVHCVYNYNTCERSKNLHVNPFVIYASQITHDGL